MVKLKLGSFFILCLCSAFARQDPGYNLEDVPQEEDAPQDASQDGDAQDSGDNAPSAESDESPDSDEQSSPDSDDQSKRMSFMAVNNRAQSQQRASWASDNMDTQGMPASFARIARNIQRWKKPAAKEEDTATRDLKEFSQGWQKMSHDMASAAAQKEAVGIISKLHVNGAANERPSNDNSRRAPQVQKAQQAQQTDDISSDVEVLEDNGSEVDDSAPAEFAPIQSSKPSGTAHAVAKPSAQKPAWYHVPKVERKKPAQNIPAAGAPVPEDAALADAADRELEAEALDSDAPGADIPPLGAEFDDTAPPKPVKPQSKPAPRQQRPKQPPRQQQQQQQKQQPPKQLQQPQEGADEGADDDAAIATALKDAGLSENAVPSKDTDGADDADIAAAMKDAGLSENAMSLKDVDAGGDPVPATEPKPSATKPAAQMPPVDAPSADDTGGEGILSVDEVLGADAPKPTPKVAQAPAQHKASAQSKAPKALEVPKAKRRGTLSSAAAQAAKPTQRPAAVPQPVANVVADVDDLEVQPQVAPQAQPPAAIPQASPADQAAIDGAAHEEVARARAELAAAEVSRAAASRRKSVAAAQKLEQQARQMLRDSDAAWDRAQQAAAAAAKRAFSESMEVQMRKVKELEAKSRQASDKANRIRAAADADVNKAMQSLGKITA